VLSVYNRDFLVLLGGRKEELYIAIVGLIDRLDPMYVLRRVAEPWIDDARVIPVHVVAAGLHIV
jgi:hypothetical protein